MMMIFLVLVFLFVAGLYLGNKYPYSLWSVVSLAVGAILAILLIMLPICYYSDLAWIEKYHAFKVTVEEARKSNISEIERAAILQDIAEWNQDIANVKYWNKTIFDIYIPDEVESLEMLE